jgi:hypothetical protein
MLIGYCPVVSCCNSSSSYYFIGAGLRFSGLQALLAEVNPLNCYGSKYPGAGSDVDQDIQAVARGEANQHAYVHHITLHS